MQAVTKEVAQGEYTFRRSQGTWQLGINPNTSVIYHFNFIAE